MWEYELRRIVMKQRSLLDDDQNEHAGLVTSLGVIGSGPTLNKEQKHFNKLIASIDATRRELAQWQAFIPAYQQRFAAEIVPLSARLREKRIAMIMLLDRAMDGKSLNKRQKVKVADILIRDLSDLLAENQEAELVPLYDKYSPVSFEEAQRDEIDFMRAVAADTFGIELDDSVQVSTPEELASLLDEKMHDAEAGHERRRGRKGNQRAKSNAQEALRTQAAQGASKTVREVYRKLASELHPDREPDLEQRARKTVLMQQVNQAYNAGDLLALLELQLSIEQIDLAALANMAQERLAHYNRVLREQSQRLQEELSELKAPFIMVSGGSVPRQFTPDVVLRALDADIREIKLSLRGLDADLVSFRNIDALKASLKHYQVYDSGVDDLDVLDRLFFGQRQGRRR